jgi:uncharacterized protein involved in outer membrane biogenesis
MKRFIKWLLMVLVFLLLLLAAGAWGLQRWMGTDDFRLRIEQQASAALGVGLSLGRIEVALWPLPALALGEVALQTQPPVTIERLEVRPVWTDLLQGRVAPATFILRHAVLSQAGLDSALIALQKKKPSAPENKEPETDSSQKSVTRFLPRRTQLDGLTWVDAKGVATTLAAQADLSPDGWPQDMQVQILQGRLQGTQLDVQREATDLAWALVVQVGGGSIRGRLAFKPATEPGGALTLNGQLLTKDVEVSALLAQAPATQTTKQISSSPLSGRLEATTTLSAHGQSLGALAEGLHTQTQFTVHQAVLHGMDLAKAVKTVGMSRGGQTALDTLAGQVITQGKAVQLNNLVASSGLLSATGNVAISPAQALSGRVSVELGGALGVPLALGGTVHDPEVSLSRGALIGAAVGTILAPGVGTGAGASLGDKASQGFKKLFGK